MLLHTTRNMASIDNIVLRSGLRELQRRLPPGWSLGEAVVDRAGTVDARARLRAPDRRTGSLAIEAKTRLDPKDVPAVVEQARLTRSTDVLVVIARYLSESTRARLKDADVNYVDLTGNVRLIVPTPGLFIETQGASEDPDREERPARSLRGAKAGRIVRALIDRKTPPGVRELALLTKIDAGYVSRVLAFLETEALIKRVGRGRTESVDWPVLLRRWASEAPLESRGQASMYLDPRGPSALLQRLAKSNEQYVVSGGLAARALAPTAPARLATIWIRDVAEAATRLGLRAADAGANVMLVEPGDEGVFEGAVERKGIDYAAPSQVAVDLLTSPGRGPSEGEELIDWMRSHEDVWRK